MKIVINTMEFQETRFMSLMEGSGKVRLTAKNGLYQDTAHNRRQLELMRNSSGANAAHLVGKSEEYRASFTSTYTKAIDDSLDRGSYYVEFDLTPDISESSSAQYADIGDIRGPASILWYQGSPSRIFNISAKFVSRTEDEARRTSQYVHVLKSWRMPEDTSGGAVGLSPPTLLYFEGYKGMFKNIPVVMTDLSFEYSSEHDYVASSGGGFVVPILLSATITLKEAHSLEGSGLGGDGNSDGLDGFNILDYRLGKLKGW